MKPITFLSLFVSTMVLLSPSAFGAETNHNFTVWEKEIAAFEQSDLTNPPPKGGVEFIGSSMIRRWTTLAQDFPGQPVFNRGFGGSEIVDSTHFAPRIIFPYAPRMIVFRAGGNDLANGKSPVQVFSNFKEFTAVVHAKLPGNENRFHLMEPDTVALETTRAGTRIEPAGEKFCRCDSARKIS